jgi:hypothetical protein
MFVEMVCVCGASLQIDGDDDYPSWLFASRFAEAHVKCGFITPIASDTPEKTNKYELKFKPKTRQANEED